MVLEARKSKVKHCWIQCPSWFVDDCLFVMFSHGGREEESLWGLFYKGTNPFHEIATFVA